MTTLVLALMMQYVVATKAGLVNDVKGLTNVKRMQMVEANLPVRTGPAGFAELLLTPGSYLRLGPNAEVVLDNVDLTNVALHVNAGQAMVEVIEITSETPIRVTTGQTTVNLREPGIFRFRDGVATVTLGLTAPAFLTAIAQDRKSTRLNSSHSELSRMPSSA